jgi:hypothetical protein
MAPQHNRRFAAAQRRQRVTELYLKGRSQTEIAAELSVAQSTVSEDVQYVRRQWEQSAVRNYDELRTRELQKLEYIEREAWSAWDRSQKPAQSAVISGEGQGKQTRKSLKQQIGDPRFLDQVNKCIAQRRAITGLDVLPVPAPLESPIDGNLSLEVRQQRVRLLVDAFMQREGMGAAGTRFGENQPGNICRGHEPGALDDGAPLGLPGPDAAAVD